MQGTRTFTGDANIRPGLGMDSLSSEAGSQRASSTAVPAKQPASMQSAFTMGSGAAPISPSKKRTHKDLKMRQTAASSPSTQPAKANPFAPYGVNSTSSQPSRNPAQRSPGKAPPGLSPTRRPKVTVKGPKGAQSMHVDSGLPSPATAPFLGASSRAAASNTDHLSSHQPAVAQPANAFPFHADIASTGTGFPQIGVPASHVPPSQANPLPNGHATASFTYKPAVAGASTHPTVSSVSPGSPNVGVKTNASSASAAAAAAAASPAAAVTPPSFRFGSSHHSRADTSSPQVPFQGFGAAGTAQNKTPTASFAGFQTGHKTPGLSTARKVLRTKNKAASPLPPGTPMSAFSQGTPLTPMDISPQPDATSTPSAPTPLPQPQFTPAWTQAPAASGSFSFSSGSALTPERPSARQSPRTRRQASKPAADLPKSRFMPQDATDTSAAAAPPAFGAAGQSQPGSEGNAPVFGQSQPGSTGSEGNAPAFGSTAQTQQTSAGTAGTGQYTAQPTFQSAFAGGSSQAAPGSFFPSAASRSAGPSAFPFSVPGRPMDSRIKDACAMGFMGINLDSTAGSDQDARPSQMPAGGTAPSTTGSGSTTAGQGSTTAEPSTSTVPPPASSFQFQSTQRDAFSAGVASSSASDQPPLGDPAAPLSPFSFALGAEATPKPKNMRPMFSSEQVATNLHDKLVLGEDTAAVAENAGTSDAPHIPPQDQHATSADTSASAADATTMPTADSGPAAPDKAAESASGRWPAFSGSFCGTSGAGTADKPSFVFGARPAAAGAAASVSQPSQLHTFSFGTAAGSSGFPPSKPVAPNGKPFVFGAKAPAAAQPAANGSFPPPAPSQAGAEKAAAQPASVSTAPPGWSAASSASAAGHSMPTQFSAGQASSSSSAGLRNGLHSPSGIAKHTGPRSSPVASGRHSRAAPGSPGARRSVKGSPGKQLSGVDRPAGLPNGWTPVDPLADPKPGPQWLSHGTHSSNGQAAVTGQQHQAPAAQAGARHSNPAQRRPVGSGERCKVEAAAEQHRQKGNILFAKPDFIGAGQGYTKGLNVLHEGGIHDGHVFVKLLTNRAACHLSLARPLKALQDCTMAVQADPTNVRAATRAATCHLKMGQLSEASQMLDTVQATVTAAGQAPPPELVSKQNDLEVTKRLVSQATASLQGASTVAAVTQAQKLLESLSWEGGYCPFSQPLSALNAHALLRLHRFDEAVQSAKKHATPSEDRPTALHWPWWVQAQAFFLKGDLQQMQCLLQEGMQKLDQHPDHQEDVPDRQQVADLSNTAQKLLQLKEAGNKAVQASQWQDAITAYSEAINACADAPPVFSAVLHSNRAAAYQGLQQYADAVADSLRAKALDPTYGKAYSRLAAMLSSVHLSAAAVTALEQLAEIVRKQGGRDPFKTASRLDEAQRNVRRKQPVHHYRLLGLSQACTEAEIRKAYKRCSLRFHPDKAIAYCKFAPALGANGALLADRLERETRVREEANWLFKCISEANLVLSDPQKRLELNSALDFEERRMFYKNDLYTPPGGSYSFQKPQQATANPRPSAYARPSARYTARQNSTTNRSANYSWHHGLDSDSDDDNFGSNTDSGSNFY